MTQSVAVLRMKKNYFRAEVFILRMCGVSLKGNDSTSYKIYSFAVSCVYFAYPFIACGDIFKHEFFDSARVFLYVVAASIAITMAFAVLRKRIMLGKLLDKLEDVPFLASEVRGGDKEAKLIEEWATFTNKQRLAFYVPALGSVAFGVGYALIQRMRYSEPQKWVFNYGPLTVLNVTYSPNYEISWTYQSVCMSFSALTVCSITITLSGILSFASVQFQILQNSLRNLVEYSHQRALQDSGICDVCGPSAAENGSNGSDASPPWKYLSLALKETVSYHLKIFELISELEEIFSIAILATYLAILCVLCLMMFIASSLSLHDITTIRLIGEAGSACIIALLICFWGERVAHESEMVGTAAYEANFVGTDLRFQKALIIIIRRSQYPTRIKAGNIIDTSLVTFAWILRASYTYFMVLKNMKQK